MHQQGEAMRSMRLTGRNWVMGSLRSSSVVSARMMGGWMMGTSAMYE